MKITPVDHDLDLTANELPRSPGLHLSDIYGPMYKTLEPKRYGRDMPKKDMEAYQGAGLALEGMLEDGLKKRLAQRPGEFRSEEGIIISPDLLIHNGVLRLGEIKLTWMWSKEVPRVAGLNSFPPKFDKYMTQMMGYCHVLETPYARLYGFFVNGPGNFVPELLAWDIEFSAREIHENWQGLLNQARFMGAL